MIYWFAFTSVLLAIEVVFVGTCLSMLFPPHQYPSVPDLFTTYQQGISPKRDVLFLRLFILAGITGIILLMRFFSHVTGNKFLNFKYFTLVQSAVVITETFFLFKYAVFHYPLWLNGFYVSLIASALIKIFTPEILKGIKVFDESMKVKTPLPNLFLWLTAIGTVLLPLIIWVPDVQGLVARMYFGEQFHHIDGILISPAWAHFSGNILGIDTTSRYGVGAPILVAEICRHLWGRFDYVHAVIVVMMISVVYYWVWFYALRLGFKDITWAFIAIFLGLRLQFFNIETFPNIFTYPQVTPLRFFCDGFFFLFLILHLQKGRLLWLYLASGLSGFAVFYMTGEGAYVLATFYVFLILREVFIASGPKTALLRSHAGQIVLLAIIPWATLFLSLWAVSGHYVFTKLFWLNQFEYIGFYEAGVHASTLLSNLTAPYIERASLAFVFPAIYLFVFCIFLGRLMQRKLNSEGLIMASACAFLLISYHYHATVSNNMPAYLRNGVVIAMVTVYFLKEFSKRLEQYHQRLVKFFSGLLVLVMTVTTHQFLLHPNILNLSHNPMTHPVVSQVPIGRNSYFNHLFLSYPDAFKLSVNGLGEKNEMMFTENDLTDDKQLRELYAQESDYSKDAALIRSLTSPDQKVPVVSSFENLILIQADRRPFFYLYFLVNSQPRRMRKFPITMLYTKSNLRREISRIEELKPPYIFVEKTYLVSPFPQAYLYDCEDLVDLLTDIFKYYQPYQAGEFLVALKRK